MVFKFLINFTYFSSDPAQVWSILDSLSTFLTCSINQVENLSSFGSVLLLRLVNNLAVTDCHSLRYLSNQSIFSMMLQKYKGDLETPVQSELASTLSTFIIMADC